MKDTTLACVLAKYSPSPEVWEVTWQLFCPSFHFLYMLTLFSNMFLFPYLPTPVRLYFSFPSGPQVPVWNCVSSTSSQFYLLLSLRISISYSSCYCSSYSCEDVHLVPPWPAVCHQRGSNMGELLNMHHWVAAWLKGNVHNTHTIQMPGIWEHFIMTLIYFLLKIWN